jgi:hypothetical protein
MYPPPPVRLLSLPYGERLRCASNFQIISLLASYPNLHPGSVRSLATPELSSLILRALQALAPSGTEKGEEEGNVDLKGAKDKQWEGGEGEGRGKEGYGTNEALWAAPDPSELQGCAKTIGFLETPAVEERERGGVWGGGMADGLMARGSFVRDCLLLHLHLAVQVISLSLDLCVCVYVCMCVCVCGVCVCVCVCVCYVCMYVCVYGYRPHIIRRWWRRRIQ